MHVLATLDNCQLSRTRSRNMNDEPCIEGRLCKISGNSISLSDFVVMAIVHLCACTFISLAHLYK